MRTAFCSTNPKCAKVAYFNLMNVNRLYLPKELSSYFFFFRRTNTCILHDCLLSFPFLFFFFFFFTFVNFSVSLSTTITHILSTGEMLYFKVTVISQGSSYSVGRKEFVPSERDDKVRQFFCRAHDVELICRTISQYLSGR